MLILIAHGSPRPAWRESVEQLTESLQADVGRDAVMLAYMECTPPTLMEVASESIAAGATRIRVLPLFLTSEGHVDRNVRPLVEEVQREFPHVAVDLLPPVGKHPMFRSMLAEIALGSDDVS